MDINLIDPINPINLIKELSQKVDSLNDRIKKLEVLKLSKEKLENTQIDFNEQPKYNGQELITKSEMGISLYSVANRTYSASFSPNFPITYDTINSFGITENNGVFTLPEVGKYWITYTILTNSSNIDSNLVLVYNNGTTDFNINTTSPIMGEKTVVRTYLLDVASSGTSVRLINSVADTTLSITYASIAIFKITSDSNFL